MKQKITIWASTLTQAQYIKKNTILSRHAPKIETLVESDASNPKTFHLLPDHLKKILYLDSPDVIVELNNEPLFSVEITTEAGTGHNAFQRFARLAASIESGVPAFYVYPMGKIIKRKQANERWDKINPLIFKALLNAMDIYQIPALLYYFPTKLDQKWARKRDAEVSSDGLIFSKKYPKCPYENSKSIQEMFSCMNAIIRSSLEKSPISARQSIMLNGTVKGQREKMYREVFSGHRIMNNSPLSATHEISTKLFLKSLTPFGVNSKNLGPLLKSRRKTILYQVDAGFRSDPYPGALAAIDYLKCRIGKTYEDRDKNLVLVWGRVQRNSDRKKVTYTSEKAKAEDFVNAVRNSERLNLLKKSRHDLKPAEVPRYYMQVRYGSTFSKAKHIRCFSYFADAIVFRDGVFWRSA